MTKIDPVEIVNIRLALSAAYVNDPKRTEAELGVAELQIDALVAAKSWLVASESRKISELPARALVVACDAIFSNDEYRKSLLLKLPK